MLAGNRFLGLGYAVWEVARLSSVLSKLYCRHVACCVRKFLDTYILKQPKFMHNAQWCLSLSLLLTAAQSWDLFKCYPPPPPSRLFYPGCTAHRYVTDCLLWDVCVHVWCTCYMLWEQCIYWILTELSIVVLADVRSRMLCRLLDTVHPCTLYCIPVQCTALNMGRGQCSSSAIAAAP